MSQSLYIVLILLEAVLYGTVFSTSSIQPPTSPLSTIDSLQTSTSESITSSNVTTPPGQTFNVTEESTSLGPTTKEPQTDVTDGGSGGGKQGLTSGEAAGVAVGTIAGVAALGGGIYAGLKFTGKLG